MKRSLYLLLLLLMTQAGNLFAQTTDRTAAAESVLRQLKNGCGDSLYAASTPQVQEQLKAESYNAIWQQLMEMLRRREVDFVLAFKPNVPYDDVIESYVLFEDRLSVIMRKGHPLAECSSLGVDDLKKHRLAIPAKGLQARNMIDKYFNFVDAGFNVSLEVNGVYSLLDVVENSNLLTILSDATIRDRHALKAIALDVPDNEMQGCVHILKNTYQKRSAEVFVKMLRESLALMELSGKWA